MLQAAVSAGGYHPHPRSCRKRWYLFRPVRKRCRFLVFGFVASVKGIWIARRNRTQHSAWLHFSPTDNHKAYWRCKQPDGVWCWRLSEGVLITCARSSDQTGAAEPPLPVDIWPEQQELSSQWFQLCMFPDRWRFSTSLAGKSSPRCLRGAGTFDWPVWW